MAEKELLPGEVRQLSSGCILEEFKEAKEVHQIIGNVCNIYDQQIPVEMAIERFQGWEKNRKTLSIIAYNNIYLSFCSNF